MNIFNRIMKRETTLGNPLFDSAAIERRVAHFASKTGGNGFPFPSKLNREPKKDAQGKTRRMRREERFQRAFHSEE